MERMSGSASRKQSWKPILADVFLSAQTLHCSEELHVCCIL
jgi:hypothetical protein